jgi:tyrosine-protein phosphatase SIW14
MHKTVTRILTAFAAVVLVLSTGALTVAGTRPVSPAAAHAAHPGIKNFGVVEDGIYRGAQPDNTGYKTLKDMGVKCVLNLRNDHDERAAVLAAGMTPLDVPMGMIRGMDEENVEEAVRLMSDPANRPIYVHCRLGQDRTGIVVATYRMQVDGWKLKDAESEMQSYGFNDIWINLKHLLHKLAAKNGWAGGGDTPGSNTGK